jgi:hypothetical protein
MQRRENPESFLIVLLMANRLKLIFPARPPGTTPVLSEESILIVFSGHAGIQDRSSSFSSRRIGVGLSIASVCV